MSSLHHDRELGRRAEIARQPQRRVIGNRALIFPQRQRVGGQAKRLQEFSGWDFTGIIGSTAAFRVSRNHTFSQVTEVPGTAKMAGDSAFNPRRLHNRQLTIGG
jgi:hypothetical protein